MTYYNTTNRIGAGPLTDIGSTALWPLGTIVEGQDSTLGAGEFIYLAGVANTEAGSVVKYNSTTGTTTLVPTTAGGQGYPVAVAMAANASASTYGWYQIAGTALVVKGATDFPVGSPVYASGSTAGRVASAVGTTNQFYGMITANTASVSSTTSTIYVTLDRPGMQTL